MPPDVLGPPEEERTPDTNTALPATDGGPFPSSTVRRQDVRDVGIMLFYPTDNDNIAASNRIASRYPADQCLGYAGPNFDGRT
jgi:hypothetical protein